MYCKTPAVSKDNRCRNTLITNEESVANIPPTKNALLEHIKRATYQAAYAFSCLNLIYEQEIFIASSFRLLILHYLNEELTTILFFILLCFKIKQNFKIYLFTTDLLLLLSPGKNVTSL